MPCFEIVDQQLVAADLPTTDVGSGVQSHPSSQKTRREGNECRSYDPAWYVYYSMRRYTPQQVLVMINTYCWHGEAQQLLPEGVAKSFTDSTPKLLAMPTGAAA